MEISQTLVFKKNKFRCFFTPNIETNHISPSNMVYDGMIQRYEFIVSGNLFESTPVKKKIGRFFKPRCRILLAVLKCSYDSSPTLVTLFGQVLSKKFWSDVCLALLAYKRVIKQPFYYQTLNSINCRNKRSIQKLARGIKLIFNDFLPKMYDEQKVDDKETHG